MNMPPAPNQDPNDSGTAATSTRASIWTRHWARGVAHSFDATGGRGYDDAIARFWQQRFADLEAGQRVLDMATGNGALPRLLVGARPDLDVLVDAVDIASIAPAWPSALPDVQRTRLRFHGGAPMESLPFADRSFDLVTSQYGIEYADLERAVPEMLRVAGATGRIVLVMHTTRSRPVALAKVELAHLDWLLSDEGLPRAAASILQPLGLAATPQGRAALADDPIAEAARRRFNDAQQTLRERARAHDGADVLSEAQDAVARICMLAGQGRVDDADRRLRALCSALEDARTRLVELRRHALGDAQFAALQDAIRPSAGTGGRIEAGEIHERGHLMGWTLDARLGRTQ